MAERLPTRACRALLCLKGRKGNDLQPTGFARLIALLESRSAMAALTDVARALPEPVANPLFLHGPTGAGKSCLVTALLEEATGFTHCVVSANAFPLPWDQDESAAAERHDEARRCDLLIVEDLQHLPAR